MRNPQATFNFPYTYDFMTELSIASRRHTTHGTKTFGSVEKTKPNTVNVQITKKDEAKDRNVQITGKDEAIHRKYSDHWKRRSQTQEMFRSLEKTKPNTGNVQIIDQDREKHKTFVSLDSMEENKENVIIHGGGQASAVYV